MWARIISLLSHWGAPQWVAFAGASILIGIAMVVAAGKE